MCFPSGHWGNHWVSFEASRTVVYCILWACRHREGLRMKAGETTKRKRKGFQLQSASFSVWTFTWMCCLRRHQQSHSDTHFQCSKLFVIILKAIDRGWNEDCCVLRNCYIFIHFRLLLATNRKASTLLCFHTRKQLSKSHKTSRICYIRGKSKWKAKNIYTLTTIMTAIITKNSKLKV